jgi:hypothetical protein
MGTCLFVKPLFSNGYHIFAYLTVVASGGSTCHTTFNAWFRKYIVFSTETYYWMQEQGQGPHCIQFPIIHQTSHNQILFISFAFTLCLIDHFLNDFPTLSNRKNCLACCQYVDQFKNENMLFTYNCLKVDNMKSRSIISVENSAGRKYEIFVWLLETLWCSHIMFPTFS